MNKKYDLEERTFQFAKVVALMVKKLPKYETNNIYMHQLIKASSSVGANYIGVNEALSKKDFLKYVRISRKEVKASHYWLRLLNDLNDFKQLIEPLMQEAFELKLIFSSIIEKSMKNMNIIPCII